MKIALSDTIIASGETYVGKLALPAPLPHGGNLNINSVGYMRSFMDWVDGLSL